MIGTALVLRIFRADLETVLLGQHDVEDHEIRIFAGELVQADGWQGRGNQFEIEALEVIAEQPSEFLVVID